MLQYMKVVCLHDTLTHSNVDTIKKKLITNITSCFHNHELRELHKLNKPERRARRKELKRQARIEQRREKRRQLIRQRIMEKHYKHDM